jgi:osmoprotectant transport system substrate-binding protein
MRARAVLGWLCCALLAVVLAGCRDVRDAVRSGHRDAAPSQVSQAGPPRMITVGAADITEMLIVQQMYGQMLAKAGYQVTYRTVAARDQYIADLESGAIGVVPEYAATMAEYLNRQENGPAATLVASADPAGTVAALRKLAGRRDLTVLDPAKAANQNGFAVTQRYAKRAGVKSLSQLAATGRPVVLAATAECPKRPFCQPGLQRVYGLKISKVLPLGFGTAASKQALLGGQAGLALVGTTDGTLGGLGLRLLKDDRGLQLADNVVPVVNSAKAKDPIVPAAINPIAGVLTTADLAELNEQVDGERRTPAGVATAYLRAKGLI